MSKEHSTSEKKQMKVEVNQIWEAPGSDGSILRRIRILAEHPDGGWIYEELPAKMFTKTGDIRRIPEINLGIVFQLAKEAYSVSDD